MTHEVHVCARCGAAASYATGRAGLKDKKGTWWCHDHLPAGFWDGRDGAARAAAPAPRVEIAGPAGVAPKPKQGRLP